jgi:hypothetical protein
MIFPKSLWFATFYVLLPFGISADNRKDAATVLEGRARRRLQRFRKARSSGPSGCPRTSGFSRFFRNSKVPSHTLVNFDPMIHKFQYYNSICRWIVGLVSYMDSLQSICLIVAKCTKKRIFFQFQRVVSQHQLSRDLLDKLLSRLVDTCWKRYLQRVD